MPAIPDGKTTREGILKGMYKFSASQKKDAKAKVQLFGSGAIMLQVLEAQKILEEQYGIAADTWSVTSYNELRRDGLDAERANMLNPLNESRVPFVTEILKNEGDIAVFASDMMKTMPDQISKWLPLPHVTLGTDGFGRSDSRKALRDFFEVDARHITFAALGKLYKEKKIDKSLVDKATKDLNIDPKKLNPMIS